MLRPRSLLLWMVTLFAIVLSTSCWHGRAERRRAERERRIEAALAADETAIRTASAEWNKAAVEKDLARAVSFYANDAIEFGNNGPMLRGKENIRKGWEQMFAMPGLGLSFELKAVEVSRSGDIAWGYGTYEFATADKKNHVTTDKGKYIEVWKKQPDGSWKAVAEMNNSGQ